MEEISKALSLDCNFDIKGDDYLPSKFSVTDLAAWSIGSVGCAIASLVKQLGFASNPPSVEIDRRLSSLWFGFSISPIDWELPPIWDAIAGDYQTSDGWIKLHTNLAHHRAAALSVLGVNADRNAVATAVRSWEKDQLESAIVQAGGVSAAMRTRDEWRAHPQGKAIAQEPLIDWGKARHTTPKSWAATRTRPLSGLRVLDLTRVLAGPVATRTLAGFGANVLRIDPVDWDEPNVVPDVTIGKKCARLDLKSEDDRQVFEQLLASADVLMHGYRPGALERLGFGETERLKISPALIEVSLDAYGWTGPWRARRGFDSLVQMSCGIADAGMHWANQNAPTPLPVQALDHATGYLMAAATMRALEDMAARKGARNARLSLARTAELLFSHPQDRPDARQIDARSSDFAAVIEKTPWGCAHRLRPAVKIAGTPMEWSLPSCTLGSSPPGWN
ncbi:MAG: acyl-CoA transferase [Alphaproteobacteria bacterium]|nr:acyl-CoA transferase [Alphaproteobacteria bacterium]